MSANRVLPAAARAIDEGATLLATFSEADAVLRSSAFESAGWDGFKEILGGIVGSLAGKQHAERRRLEARLFRSDVVAHYERKVLPAAIAAELAELRQSQSGEGPIRLDLVDWSAHVVTRVMACFIGLDGVDSTARIQRLIDINWRLRVAHAGGLNLDPEERVRRMPEALAALHELRDEFFAPSLERRRRLQQHGRLVDSDADLLSVLIEHGGPEWGDELLLRETAQYVLGSLSPADFLVKTVIDLERWLAEHPGDRFRCSDRCFLARVCTEAIRRSPSPYILRRAVRDADVAGRPYREGDEVVIDKVAANHDQEAFGTDAAVFDPHRGHGSRPYGTSFGGGTHVCIGRPLTVGSHPEGDPDPEAVAGLQVRMLEWLYAAGLELPVDAPPVFKDALVPYRAWCVSFPALLASV